MPREQFIDLCDLVVWDAGEGIGEPGVWIDGVEFCRFDQGVGDGGGLAACFGADEEVILPPDGNGAHPAFSGVVAGQPGADDAVHDEAPGDVFQFLGDVFADPSQTTAAVSAGRGIRPAAA